MKNASLGTLIFIAVGSGNCGSSGGAQGGGSGGANGSGGATSTGGTTGSGGAAATGGASGITCAPPSDVNKPSAKLSQTGCVNPTAPTQFAAGVIPYQVNSPLWSDAADKTRGLVLPAGGKIHVKNCAATPSECPTGPADDGKWVFPVGTVMVKTFGFDGKLVETRLFVNHDANTWVGYSYAWDEAQTDATIVPDSEVQVMFNTGTRTVTWNYPSRQDCMKCHKPTGGSTLGLETAQMNRTAPSGSANQIDQLTAMNLFDAPVPTPYKAALPTPYASQSGTPPASATITQRARSYLHANCSFCHRPDDPDVYSLDLRYDTDFADTNTCGAPASKNDLGHTTGSTVDPGDPTNSFLWLRMDAQPDSATVMGGGRMPPLASVVLDQNALDLVGQWITSIASCPTPN